MSTRVPWRGKDIRERIEGDVARRARPAMRSLPSRKTRWEETLRAEDPDTALYRRLVRFLLPVHFRERHGEELVWVFGELLMEAHTRRGSRGRAWIWLREVPALLQLTWRVRRRGYAPGVEGAAEPGQPRKR